MASNISDSEAQSSGMPATDTARNSITDRNTSKAAANPNKKAAVENIQAFPTQGYALTKKIPDATNLNALDFYRNGPTSTGLAHIGERMVEEFDDKPASIRVYGKGKTGGKKDRDLVPPYTKFFLENQRESHVEKSQIIETFGDFYVFFFGERPSVYNFSGTLMNTRNANWLQDFMFYYENFMRGTKCVEYNARLVLTYGGRQIEGFMLNSSTGTQASLEKGVQFSFDVIVIDRKVLNLSYDFGLVDNGTFGNQNPFLKALIDNGSAEDVSKMYGFVKKVVNAKKKPAVSNPLGTGDLAALSIQFPGIKLGASSSGGVSTA